MLFHTLELAQDLELLDGRVLLLGLQGRRHTTAAAHRVDSGLPVQHERVFPEVIADEAMFSSHTFSALPFAKLHFVSLDVGHAQLLDELVVLDPGVVDVGQGIVLQAGDQGLALIVVFDFKIVPFRQVTEHERFVERQIWRRDIGSLWSQNRVFLCVILDGRMADVAPCLPADRLFKKDRLVLFLDFLPASLSPDSGADILRVVQVLGNVLPVAEAEPFDRIQEFQVFAERKSRIQFELRIRFCGGLTVRSSQF